jgi:hypothetical protein
MENKIKIALCLSGEPRSTMASFPYMYETFLRDNAIYFTDVYLHSLKGFRALDLYKPKKSYIELTDINSNYRLIGNSLSSFLNTNYPSPSPFSVHSSSLINQIIMFDSIKKSIDIIEGSYDIVIRARYDMLFSTKFFIEPIINDILNNKYDIFIPHENHFIYEPQDEFCDQFAIGNPNSMAIYSNIINNIFNIMNKTKFINSQKWLKYWLDNNNIKVHQSFLEWALIRQCHNITNKSDINTFLDE